MQLSAFTVLRYLIRVGAVIRHVPESTMNVCIYLGCWNCCEEELLVFLYLFCRFKQVVVLFAKIKRKDEERRARRCWLLSSCFHIAFCCHLLGTLLSREREWEMRIKGVCGETFLLYPVLRLYLSLSFCGSNVENGKFPRDDTHFFYANGLFIITTFFHRIKI